MAGASMCLVSSCCIFRSGMSRTRVVPQRAAAVGGKHGRVASGGRCWLRTKGYSVTCDCITRGGGPCATLIPNSMTWSQTISGISGATAVALG